MIIKYIIHADIFNKLSQTAAKLRKEYEYDVNVLPPALYDNDHIITQKHIYEYLGSSFSEYLKASGCTSEDILVQSFEAECLTEGVELYFANLDEPSKFTLSPTLIVFVPKPVISIPVPTGLEAVLTEPTTIKWSWNPEEGEYAHLIVDINGNVVASLPIGMYTFLESGLEYNKNYTRRIIRMSKDGQSLSSNPVTITTGAAIEVKPIKKPFINDNKESIRYEERVFTPIEERLEAFQSGIGDNVDLLVRKQSSDEFFESFNLLGVINATRNFIAKVYPPVPVTVDYKAIGEVPVKHYKGDVTIAIAISKLYDMTINVDSVAYKPMPVKWRLCADVIYQEVNPKALEFYETIASKL